MLDFFKKKKYLSLIDYPENWLIIEEKINPAIVRINMGYKEAIGHPDYPIKMGIAIPVIEHNHDVMDIKHEIEIFLGNLLLKEGNGSLVAIITGLEKPKFIEFLSYVKKGINYNKIHQDLKEKFKDYQIQMYADYDVNWEAYKSFAHIPF